MRVLLDECLPRGLAREIAGHEVSTVGQAGWSGIKNGELLRLAARDYKVLITIDQSLESQHRLPPGLAAITLSAPSNRLEVLRPLVPRILEALESIRPGDLVRISA